MKKNTVAVIDDGTGNMVKCKLSVVLHMAAEKKGCRFR